jgi:hypothetical protein
MINCEKEIIELHQFFQHWFNGTIPQDEDIFARFANVMDAGFHRVAPNGRLTPRALVVDGLRKMYGRSQHDPGRIWAKNVQIRYEESHLVLASYEEWQSFNGQTTARMSTVLFRMQPDAPNGVVWLYLHETWIENEG